MQTTNCSAVLVDSMISHLHFDILRKDAATGVTPIVIAHPPFDPDPTRDGIARALSFLSKSKTHSAAELKKEAEGGAFYLHTSGSTGHPKAISWSHEFLLALCAANYRDRARCNDDVLYTCFPMFHAGGICTSFPFFLGSGASFVCLDTWRSISVDAILRHLRILKKRKVDASLPPSMLEDIADSTDAAAVGTLAAQNTVFWGGAPLRDSAGDYLVRHGVKLVAWGGSTEAGPLARSSLEENADPADWMYMRLVDYYEFNWYPMKGDPHGRYNLIVSPVHATPPIVNSLDPIGFATVDGWLQHPDPTKSHLWKPAGRLDDVTVLSNGEKTDNKQLEELLCASRYVYQAIIFGTGKFVNGAIVMPPAGLVKSDDDEHVDHYLDLIWPHIEDHVNKIVPRHSRLLRGMVLVARSERPFLTSDKGTVKTKATLALYKEDIDRAYEALERGTDAATAGSDLPLQAVKSDESKVLAFVHALVSDAIGRSLGPEDDFFRNGMDSLVATKLRTSLSAAIRRVGIPTALPRNVVYTHPSCTALSRFLITFAAAEPEKEDSAAEGLEEEIETMIDKYSRNLPCHEGKRAMPNDGDVYAVTGTTGSLGASFVAHLLARPQVKKVYLLNRAHRSQSMVARQEMAFKDKGLSISLLRQAIEEGRVVFVEIEVGKDRLGISNDVYDMLTWEVTHIVHNAWLLNFNLLLHHFEPHVAGTRSIIELALSSSYQCPPHITFISSIGATARWPFRKRPIPEAALNSPEFCIPQGYSYAKYVSEQVIQSAVAHRPCLRAAIIRCSQLSGSLATGAWQKSEYVPRLLRSVDALGMVPTGLAPVRWLPVDVAADMLFREIEHATSQPAPGPLRYYTLDTTQYTPWQRVVDSLVALKPERRLKRVPMAKFLDEVRKDTENPAFEVAEHLEDLLVAHPIPMLSVTQARRAAGNLVDCEISEQLLRSYVRYACS
ncbi:male sterility protein-domain-containing protein [Dichomitus squalens]|nr:male sterility protein-domain-containing protein [Dichomitus squalens]